MFKGVTSPGVDSRVESYFFHKIYIERLSGLLVSLSLCGPEDLILPRHEGAKDHEAECEINLVEILGWSF